MRIFGVNKILCWQVSKRPPFGIGVHACLCVYLKYINYPNLPKSGIGYLIQEFENEFLSETSFH
jgi:hypothetical protein